MKQKHNLEATFRIPGQLSQKRRRNNKDFNLPIPKTTRRQ